MMAMTDIGEIRLCGNVPSAVIMHPDLSPHLHTDECNALIAALQKCHVDHPYKKFMGVCNEMERAMSKCIKREREMKRYANSKKGAARQTSS